MSVRRGRIGPHDEHRLARGSTTPRTRDALDDDLTPAQMRELQRRVDDLHDATRFLLVSQMAPRFALYYNVTDDVYAMNNPKGGTLFKRRNVAVAVKAFLGKSVRILRCQSKRVNGVRVPIVSSMKRRNARTPRLSSNSAVHRTGARVARSGR